VVEGILDARGPAEHRWYLVHWEGYLPVFERDYSQATWEPESHVGHAGGEIAGYWAQSQWDECDDIPNPPDQCQLCVYCGDVFAKPSTLKAHLTKSEKKGGCPDKPRSRKGSRADKAIQTKKHVIQQEELEKVMLNGKQLKNVYRFKYLGYNFQADGDHKYNLEVRMAIAGERFGKMRHLWRSKVIGRNSKLKLFGAAVVSVLEYGCEVWRFDNKLQSTLKGWCARKVSLFTGKSIREECHDPSFNLVNRIWSKRLKWLGKILRADESYMVRKALIDWARHTVVYPAGSIMEGAPKHESIEDLVALAQDMDGWSAVVNAYKCKSGNSADSNKTKTTMHKGDAIKYLKQQQRDLLFRG
jgi:hypothetical protein